MPAPTRGRPSISARTSSTSSTQLSSPGGHSQLVTSGGPSAGPISIEREPLRPVGAAEPRDLDLGVAERDLEENRFFHSDQLAWSQANPPPAVRRARKALSSTSMVQNSVRSSLKASSTSPAR